MKAFFDSWFGSSDGCCVRRMVLASRWGRRLDLGRVWSQRRLRERDLRGGAFPNTYGGGALGGEHFCFGAGSISASS